MKYPLKYTFLQNIASRYCQISTHKVAKILIISGQNFNHTKSFSEYKVLQNEVLARKTVENQRILLMKHLLKNIFAEYSIMIVDKLLFIRLQKSNSYGQKFIILNFSKYKVLKMKF